MELTDHSLLSSALYQNLNTVILSIVINCAGLLIITSLLNFYVFSSGFLNLFFQNCYYFSTCFGITSSSVGNSFSGDQF